MKKQISEMSLGCILPQPFPCIPALCFLSAICFDHMLPPLGDPASAWTQNHQSQGPLNLGDNINNSSSFVAFLDCLVILTQR